MPGAGPPNHPHDRRAADPTPVEGTRIESIDEIRQALARRAGPGGPAPTAPLPPPAPVPPPAPAAPSAVAPAAPDPNDAVPFRPVRRPPTALLCVLDDGKDDGEWVRLRKDRTVIGRVEGDVVVPHDPMVSGKHAEITRQPDQGRFRWVLSDLQSTNGTYLRVGSAVLKHQQEFLIGGRRFRFDAAPQGTALEEEADKPVPKGTVGWSSLSANELIPSLLEITPKGEGQRYFLTKTDLWIGRAPACGVAIPTDPLLSPQHARLYKDPKGRWHLDNNRSLNGIWLRVEQAPLDATCYFQLGEQRFLLRVLS